MRVSRIIAALLLFVALPLRAALVFNFTANSAAVPPAAMSAITLAGQRWSAVLSDNLTINIAIDFSNLAPTVIAGSTFGSLTKNYSDVVSALQAKAVTADDAISTAHLQTGSAFNFLINNPNTGSVILDNNNSFNNTSIKLTRANAKALGFMAPNGTALDGAIQFNSNLAFDFDPSNGIDSNKIDFVSDAVHEIGHILGFDSVVDNVDQDSKPNGIFAPSSVDSASPFTLDLFRYSAASSAQGIEDLSYGGSKYFSIDGGATPIANFATGVYNGDGYQPEHWEHGLNLGVMDPAFSYGQSRAISLNDIRAMDAIGYTAVVPEPATIALIFLGCFALKRQRVAIVKSSKNRG